MPIMFILKKELQPSKHIDFMVLYMLVILNIL